MIKKQSSDKSIEINVPDEPSYTPPRVRRSTRSTKGIPPTRYGSVTSHKVNLTSKFGKLLNTIAKKVDTIHDHIFDWYFLLLYILCHPLLYP